MDNDWFYNINTNTYSNSGAIRTMTSNIWQTCQYCNGINGIHSQGCMYFSWGQLGIQQQQAQQQAQPYPTITGLTVPGAYAQERTPMDTKKYKFLLFDSARVIGYYETLEEAKKTAQKKLADDKGGTYTVFQALIQIETKPLETVETPIA